MHQNGDNHIQMFIWGGISSDIWSEITFYGSPNENFYTQLSPKFGYVLGGLGTIPRHGTGILYLLWLSCSETQQLDHSDVYK